MDMGTVACTGGRRNNSGDVRIMTLTRTEKDVLTSKEVLDVLKVYEETQVPELQRRWRYYDVDNPPIMDRKKEDVNNPDNRTPSGYGKKTVTTYTGYAWRPRYTTYKVESNEAYEKQLQETFNLTNEHIKTSRVGRNIGIFGVARELLYTGKQMTGSQKLPTKAQPKIASVDPRNMVTLYDYEEEPNIKIAIKYDEITPLKQTVDVFYADRIEQFIRTRDQKFSKDWKISSEPTTVKHWFKEVPVIDYFLDDDVNGLIKPITKYIDDLDILTSGGIDEFMRFAESYLRVVGASLDDPVKAKSANTIQQALRRLKKSRVFNRLKDKDDITFLTKEIPSEYIRFIIELVIDQIHTQSHVPDFAKFSDLSGIAVQRLMFDFENVCATAEANVDAGLIKRIRLINNIYKQVNRPVISESEVTISHKRNMPLNLNEFADTAVKMKEAGMSRYLIADIFPDDVIPDVNEELKRQDEDRKAMMSDLYGDDSEVRETSVQPDSEE